jgi:preprotein translocase subunit SecD
MEENKKDMMDQAGDMAAKAKEVATEKLADVKEDAAEVVANLKEEATEKLAEAKEKMTELAASDPIGNKSIAIVLDNVVYSAPRVQNKISGGRSAITGQFTPEEAQDLGLDELIQFDSTGIPDYFSYEKLPIFLLQLVQELKAEIDQLKGA